MRSIHRMLLDRALNARVDLMRGRVLELGGLRDMRGAVRYPRQLTDAWVIADINLDRAKPDVRADVHHLPFRTASLDAIVCSEVIEHVADARQALHELRRVMRDGAALVLTIPFLYPEHADPYDFRRMTRHGLNASLSEAGFAEHEISSLCGYWGTLANQLSLLVMSRRSRAVRWALWVALMPGAQLLAWIDSLPVARSTTFARSFTTGYVVVARASRSAQA